ncbi:hypothetical protein HYALB_00000146 [Hymenoscyphus albidus]|uniref:Uncharacterized protein n=1 Tax=Hymenoscyphus albidus TaxID=595503 RepID=A0A9N9LGM5_9HELO|nr:hypothetical protein HYALB_00000146 [Hymenoscyphus albidus]
MTTPIHKTIDVHNDLRLRALLAALDRSPNQAPVLRLWGHSIIPSFFPTSEGFATYFKMPHSKESLIRSAEVFGVRRALCGAEDPSVFVQKEILVLVCKPPDLDTPESWSCENEELVPYMLPLPYSGSEQGPPAEYVAIAIGRRIQFFRWRAGEKVKLKRMDKDPFDIFSDEDARMVARRLNGIKDRTWDYEKWKPVSGDGS